MNPQLVAEMAAAELKGLREQGVLGAYKHFPDTELLREIPMRDTPARTRAWKSCRPAS